MTDVWLASAVMALVLSSCSAVPPSDGSALRKSVLRAVPSTPGQTSFEGWLRYRGEVMLYESQRSLSESRKAPYCISGQVADPNVDPAKFEGRRVIITGKLINYETLPYEQRPLIPRRVLGEQIISNWCFGDKVLLIDSISAA